MFTIVEVAADAPSEQEQLGTKFKFWYRDWELGHCLFKKARANTGEDWAEKIAAYLCEQLEIPHARYELATWQCTAGVVTASVLADSEQLILGNQLLGNRLHDYGATRTRRGGNPQQTVDNVLRCLEAYLPPREERSIPFAHAGEVFLGYLMLDALVGNADRHDENWACIADSNGANARLAPTFDHASSLGRELRDERRAEMLTTRDRNRDIKAYCTSPKSLSPLYREATDTQPLSMTGAFFLAAKRYPDASRAWLDRLARLERAVFEAGFAQIPKGRISELGVRCGVEILSYNRKAIQEEKGG